MLESPTQLDSSAGRGADEHKTIRIAVLLVLLGVALHARSVEWGFFYDDFVHQMVLQRGVPGSDLRPWSLYSFGSLPEPGSQLFEMGAFPWWTSPDFKIRFFRPITSLSIWLDYQIYGGWAPGYHVTSLALFAILLTLSFKLFVNLGAPPRAALWSLAILALEDCHHLPIGWIANRNTLLSASFVVACLLCYHHFRQTRKGGYLLGAMACFLLGCGSKESGLMALPLIVLYHLVLVRRDESRSLTQTCVDMLRIPSLYLFAAIAIGFLSLYVVGGYGTRSTIYTVPWLEPLDYLRKLAVLLPVGMGSLLAGMVTDIIPAVPHLTWHIVGISLGLLALPAVILWRLLRQTPLARFALGWAILCLLPEAGAEFSDRLYMASAIGTSILIGLFLDLVSPFRELFRGRRIARLIVTAGFLINGLVLAPILVGARVDAIIALAEIDLNATRTADIDPHASPGLRVFVLNGPSPLALLNLPVTWSVMHPEAQSYIYPLQLARRPLVWTRQSEDTMTLTSEGMPFLQGRYEPLFVADSTVPPEGAQFITAQFTATVEEGTSDGIRAVRFQFKRSLDDPSYRFLAWQDDRLRRITPPAIGETIRLAEVKRPHPFVP